MGNNAEDLTESSSATTSTAKTPRKGSFQVSSEPVVPNEADQSAHKFEVGSEGGPTALPGSRVRRSRTTAIELPGGDRFTSWLAIHGGSSAIGISISGSIGPATCATGSRSFSCRVLSARHGEESTVEIKPGSAQLVRGGELAGYGLSRWRSATSTVAAGGRRILASNMAHTPPDALAPETDADFATVPAHLTFERLLDLVQERMAEGETLIAALARVAGEGRVQFRPGMAPTWTDDQKRLLAALLGDSLIDRLGLGSEEIDQTPAQATPAEASQRSGQRAVAPVARRTGALHAEPFQRRSVRAGVPSRSACVRSAASSCT